MSFTRKSRNFLVIRINYNLQLDSLGGGGFANRTNSFVKVRRVLLIATQQHEIPALNREVIDIIIRSRYYYLNFLTGKIPGWFRVRPCISIWVFYHLKKFTGVRVKKVL